MTEVSLHPEYAKSVALYDGGYYGQKLKEGTEFQDYVTCALYNTGLVVVGFSSKSYQKKVGENLLGLEIKRDGRFRETKNLYIETHETIKPELGEYLPSGIFREDNSWLWLIGDEQGFFIFGKKFLQSLARARGWHEVKTPSSIGVLMPLKDAEKFCLKKFGDTT